LIHKVQKSKCALTRRAANMKQPIENRPTFSICNSSLAHTVSHALKIDQHSSSSCKGTFGLLHFMGQTQ